MSIPGVLVGAVLLGGLAPVSIPVLWTLDAIRGRRGATARAYAFVLHYLVCEVAGVAWLAALGLRPGGARDREGHMRIQRWWTHAVFAGAARIYGWTVTVDGAECLAEPGPILLLLRHSSAADTMIPGAFLTRGHGFATRYVMKDGLAWDPCLDLFGHRLPNAFVTRGSGRPEEAIEAMLGLLEGLEPDDAVVVYPEGTRFSPRARDRALAGIEAAGDDERLARMRELRHVLPPRRAGPLALLERAVEIDVVLCAHTGLEGARSFGELMAGRLVGQDVRLRFRRVPAVEVPRARDACLRWLDDRWLEIDDWIDTHVSGPPVRR